MHLVGDKNRTCPGGNDMNRYVTILCFLFLLLPCAQTFAAGKAEEKQDDAQTLVIAVNSLIVNVDGEPILPLEETGGLDAHSYNVAPMAIYSLVYEPLIRYSTGGELVPGLAESWEISEDGKTYTFRLREDVQFSDGSPFDASVVKFNMERLKNKMSTGWMKMDDFEEITVVDDYTVTITYPEPYYPILYELTLVRPQRMMAPESVRPEGDPEGDFVKPLGTGPFKVVGYTKDEEFVLGKNEFFRGGDVGIDRIVMKLIPDQTTQLMALRAGEVDFVGTGFGSVSPSSIPTLIRRQDLQIVTAEGDVNMFLIPNYQREPLGNATVRRAICHAIDNKAISESLFAGVFRPAKGIFSTSIPYYGDALERGIVKGYDYDPGLARQLLDQAGWSDTDGDGFVDDGEENMVLELVIPYVMPWEGMPISNQKPLAEAVKSYLEASGIRVTIRAEEGGQWWNSVSKSYDYDLYLYGPWGAPYDPHNTIMSYWYSNTRLKYSDPEFDQMMDRVLVTMDKDKRQFFYDQVFSYIEDKALVAPLFQSEMIFAYQEYVENFTIPPAVYEYYNLQNISVGEE